MEWKETRGMRSGFPRNFSVRHGLGEVEACMVGKTDVLQLGYMLRFFVGSLEWTLAR